MPRMVALDPVTVVSLREYRKRQVEERLAWGAGYEDQGLVFCRENGSPIRPALITATLPKLAAAAGLPRLTPHGLRHSWASVALARGVHAKVVSGRLGHASIAITLDLYSHLMPGLDEAAAATVAAAVDRR